jgi:hypothetical protein
VSTLPTSVRVPSYISRTCGRSAGDVRASVAKASQTALLAAGLLVLVSRSVREPAVEDGGQDRELPELARG